MDEGGITAPKMPGISHKDATNPSFNVVIKHKDLDIFMNSG